MSFISDHTLLVAFFFILAFLIWKFGIQPHIKMTDHEIGVKVRETMEEITENVSVNPEDILDEDSMPKLS